jgi:hypothetical protein
VHGVGPTGDDVRVPTIGTINPHCSHCGSDDRGAPRGAAAREATMTQHDAEIPVERGELIVPADTPGTSEDDDGVEAVESPAKVMRIGSMVKQLLDEVRAAPLDERGRERLAAIYQTSVDELATSLSPDLQTELRSLALPFRDGEIPTEAELRIAQAQLVGWLEGLFHGIQATLFAQQLAARQQQDMRQLPPGVQPGPPQSDRPGTYL